MNFVKKSAKRALSIMLVLALVMGSAFTGGLFANWEGAVYADSEYPTATVTITSTGEGAFLHDPVTKAVSANLAESYGYTDGISATQGVSLVDVLVQANIEVYGETDFAAAPTTYLEVSGGWASNIFAIGPNALITINGVQATTGIEGSYGGYSALSYDQTGIYDGDLVEITMLQDKTSWTDYATWFEYNGNRINHINVKKGTPVELTLKGVSKMSCNQNREVLSGMTTTLRNTEIYAGTSTPLTTTDSEGVANVTFADAGEYTLTIPGSKETAYYSQPCLVVNVVDGELSDQQKAENEAQFLSWDDIRNGNDSVYNVSSNLALPKTQGDASITWASSKTDVITGTGKVTPDCYDDYVVTLTATVKVGNSTVKKPFVLQVYKDTDESHRPVAIMTAEEQKAKIAEVVAALTNEKIMALDPNLMMNRDVLAAYLSQGGELNATQKTAVLKQVQLDILSARTDMSGELWGTLSKDVLVLCAMGIDPREVKISGNTYNLLEIIYTAPTSVAEGTMNIYKIPYALMAYVACDDFEIPSDATLSKDYLLNKMISRQAEDGSFSLPHENPGDSASIVLGLAKYKSYSSGTVPEGTVTRCIERAKERVKNIIPAKGSFSVADDNAFIILFYTMMGEDPAGAQKGESGYADVIDGLFSFYLGRNQGFSNTTTKKQYQLKATSEGYRACAAMSNFYDNDDSTKANIYDFSGKTLAVETAWPESKNLESITVENTKGTYYVGEPGRAEYTTVTAIYSDGTREIVHNYGQKNINPNLVFGKAPLSAGSDKEISVTYSETIDGAVASKQTTFPITAIANPASANIKVYVTLANQGVLAKDKKGKEIAQTEVNVKDQNFNGIYDIDDVLYYADYTLCKGTSVEGYAYTESDYGPMISKLLGVETISCGYWKNNNSCWSLTDEVAANDYVTAFVYKDRVNGSDKYSAFAENTYNVDPGNNVEVTLNKYAWDNDAYSYVASPCADAKLFILGTNNGDDSTAVTNAEGKYTLRFATAGTRYLVAYKADGSIVPAVTKIVVGSGGGSTPAPAVGDTVTFTLKGDTVHSNTLHKGTNYPTWIAKTTVELSSSVKTVGDVFKTVLDDNGYTYEGLSDNYVRFITTPDGTELGEFTNGQNSGWLYSVNGEVPPTALNDYILEDGDDIIWYYTDDYTKDSGSKKYMDNTETPQPTPTPGTTASESVETTATVKDGKAVAEVKAADVATAIEKVGGEKADNKEVVLEIKGTNGADAIEAGIPAAAVKELDKADVDVAIKTEGGNVTIPADAMGNIAAQSGNHDLTVTMENKKPADAVTAAGGAENLAKEAGISSEALAGASITEVNMTAGGKNITSFGGSNIELYIPLKGNFVAGHSYRGAAISASGSIEGFIADCVKMAGQMFAKVKSGHLTTFVITNEEVKNPFTDVKSGDYFFQPVLWAVSKDVTGGVSETSFAPNAGCTRAQMVTFLWRAAGKPWASANKHFSDVADGAYYKDAVEWAIAAGITNGVSETVFDPNGAVTREQLASFIYRYAQSKGQGFTGAWMFLLDYSDASKISSWADEAMHWCVMKEIVGGTGNNMLSPQGTATRGQIVTMLYRYFNL